MDYGAGYLIGKDGQETLLVDKVAVTLSWSPNERSIATWWRGPELDDFVNPLAIVEIDSRNIMIYAFRSNGNIPGINPIWSPDGRFIAFNEEILDGADNQVIIFDTQEQRAFKQMTGFFVRGWMAAP
jgi:hypothetical protein